jgi:hypothetical protein
MRKQSSAVWRLAPCSARWLVGQVAVPSPALKMAARQIVGASGARPLGRTPFGPTDTTRPFFMVSGCPSADGHERLLCNPSTRVGQALRLSKLAAEASGESGFAAPLCGKAPPFRAILHLLFSPPQAGRLSLPACGGGGRRVRDSPESQRLSASRSGRAALCASVSWWFNGASPFSQSQSRDRGRTSVRLPLFR